MEYFQPFFYFIIVFLCFLLRGMIYCQVPVEQGCFKAGCYLYPDFLLLLCKDVTLRITVCVILCSLCVILSSILKMRIRDALCRRILENASFTWFPLLLVPERLKPALRAPFVPVAEMLKSALRELSVISAEVCTVKGFGT